MRLIDADWVLAALGVFNDRKHGDAHFFNGIASAEEIVEHAPTIATRDWTPCAEGMPTKTADYKVTVQVGSEMGTWRETKIIPYRVVDGVGEWILPKSDWLIYGVIAWTKADEPWTGGLDGK